jgi:hypothetical protein
VVLCDKERCAIFSRVLWSVSSNPKANSMRKTIRLLDEEFQELYWIDPVTRLRMLAEGSVEEVYRATGGGWLSTDREVGPSDGTVKIRTRPAKEIGSDLPASRDSSCSLTFGDMLRNAAGAVDTPKRSLVHKLRHDEEDPQNIPAAIRSYGRDEPAQKGKLGKPNPQRLGNGVDASMTRVENWFAASAENAKTVVIACGTVIGITERPLEPQSTFAL